MADVTFEFGGDASSLKQALEEIKGEVRKTGSTVSSITGQMVGAFAAVGAAITALKGAFSFVSNIPAQAARIEDLRVSFSQLMGDAQKAGSLLNSLWADAAHGAVSLEEMAAAAKPLLNVLSDSSSIREWTNRFADMSTGAGIAADQLSKVFARSLELGRVDSRSVETLAKQGIPIYQELAAVLNTTTQGVQAMLKKGEVSADAYAAALRKMTDAGGQYHALSSQLSGTAAGSWATLTENINRLVAKLGQPINEAITPLLQSLATYIEQLAPDIEAMANSFVSCFQGAATIIAPLLGGFVELVSALGGAKTVLAAVAAALLIYSSNAVTAGANTATLRTQVTSLITTLRGFNMASFTAMFNGAMAGIRSSMAATLTGMKMLWATAWSTMATITRAAMLAVKAAIVSTGIGIIIVAIGEALSALYSWFMGNSEAAQEAAESAKQFEKALKDIDKQASKVKTYEQYDSFMENLQEQIDQLREAREEAYKEGKYDKGDQITAQLKKLWEQQAAYRKTLPLQVEAARAEERKLAAIKAQAEASRELTERINEAQGKLNDLMLKQREMEREQYLNSLGAEQQISLRLADAGGFASLEALRAEIKRMEGSYITSPEDADRYEQMLATYNKIVEIKRKDADDTKKEAVEAAKQREATDEARRDYNARMNLLQAELAQDEKKLEILKRQQQVVELTADYRRQGLEDAAALAQRMVDAELAAEIARKKQSERESPNSNRSAGAWLQGSQAGVGGGGNSYLLGGGPMLTESKKHSKLLQEVRDAVRKNPAIKVSGNVDAVMAE